MIDIFGLDDTAQRGQQYIQITTGSNDRRELFARHIAKNTDNPDNIKNQRNQRTAENGARGFAFFAVIGTHGSGGMVIAKRSEGYRKHCQRIRRIGRMITASIEQRGNVDILRQAKNTENKAERHKNNQHHGNTVHRAGRMPNKRAKNEDKQNGRQFAVQPNQRRQNHPGCRNVGIKENTADEINGEIIDEIGAAAKHIMRHRIERDANIVAFIGFQQHPAGNGHDNHGDEHDKAGPERPRTRSGTGQAKHARADANTGDNTGTAKDGRLFIHVCILFFE